MDRKAMLVKIGWRLWLFFILLTGILTSCKSSLPVKTTDTPGSLLFQEDFLDVKSGWNRVSETNGSADYEDGVYRIQVNIPNTDIWAVPGREFQDVRVEVDAFKVSGDRNNRFGIICRVTNATDFYTFVISSDGYYGIGKVKGLDYRLLGMEALLRSDKIPPGAGFLHLRADCVGDTLTLYVNGEMIYQTRDAELTAGDVGLTAGTYRTPGTDIRFDNFMVYQP
jgi:hypothetical protein